MNELFNSRASKTNIHCLCKTVDKTRLEENFSQTTKMKDFFIDHESLFSDTSVYLSQDDISDMKKIISTIESVLMKPEFQDIVFHQVPEVALSVFGPKGVFMGYDFHLSEEGPKLIEINTNAGGAYLNLILARAQKACCEGVEPITDLEQMEKVLLEMFQSEWELQGRRTELRTIAIIDVNPSEQFLYPEFQLFQNLFESYGYDSVITDPTELSYRDSGLYYQNKKIDLIYNRITDFYLSSPELETIKKAYSNGDVVVTPSPHHHALFARKSNLELLSNLEELQGPTLSTDKIAILRSGIPKTVRITNKNQKELWSQRKNLFFKPISGFGSKATYRGDKVTHRVWQEIIASEYVAQEVVRPPLRSVMADNKAEQLKFDIRAYTYDGKLLLLAARLYSGQTTNFRTPGGGFAPVFRL